MIRLKSTDESPEQALTLTWLLRLRWVAVAGQLATIGTALWLYRVPLDLVGLFAAISVTAASNGFVQLFRPIFDRHAYAAVYTLLVVDTLILTAMLLLAGGLHNPFTSFYLLHITLATVLMSRRDAAVLTIMCFACVWFIYQLPHDHNAHWITMEMHFTGMMVTLFATGVCILLFVGRLQAELREQEELLRANQLKLSRQQRVVGLATLAAGVAHELATPLSTIAVASHELKVTAGLGCQNKSCIADSTLIRQEVDRCRAIIDRLSSRGGASATRSITLDPAWLGSVLPAYLPAACVQRLRIECQQPVVLEVDEISFLQSVAALVKNACEADPNGAEVTLRIDNGQDSAGLEVVDHGSGIPQSILDQVGEPFVTTKEPGRGMGLGLYLVQMFCFQHEGTLRFLPNEPQGTRVVMQLPVARAIL